MSSEDLVVLTSETPLGLKGCTHIYAPAGQAGEYAPLASNPYRGCGCDCLYCYVPAVTHQTREEFNAGAKPRPDYLKHLARDARKYQAAGIAEQVFFCFTTDLYNPFDTSLTRPSLQLVQEHGMGICVLTKGGSRALADIDLYRPDRDCFASTLTSLDEEFSRKWERNAALPEDRIATLKAFRERGIYTWVSLEPTLDVESSLAIVETTHEFVDLYKIGRANYLKEITRTTDWADYTRRMIDLCQRLGVAHYIKRDLQPFLPAGYHNPLRVKQHHGDAPESARARSCSYPSVETTAPIEYVPGFIPDAHEKYAALMNLPWLRRKAMYGHVVPRDEVWVSKFSYSYGGRSYAAYDGWTPELLRIKALVEAHTGIEFNSVLCNLYKDGNDWVTYHCDCEETMSADHPIASISLGAERLFQMRRKNDHKIKEQLTLADGSLVLMKAGMQQEWEHQVPKCTTPTGGRINLTFRVMTGDDKPKLTTTNATVTYETLTSVEVAEKKSSNSPQVTPNATYDAFEDVEQLKRAAYDKAKEIIGQFTERLEIELYPLLWQIRERLPHGQWLPWLNEFMRRTGFRKSVRSVQRNLRMLATGGENGASPGGTNGTGDDLVAAEHGDPVVVDDVNAPIAYGSPKEILAKRLSEMRFDLLGGSDPVDADPIRDSEARIARTVRRIEEVQLAIDEGLLAAPDAPADNPLLTKLPVPDPAASCDDPHAVLMRKAFIAAANAVNAVSMADIRPRYAPTVRFYTTRNSIKLSKYLREHCGAELQYRHWRGKHCFSLVGGGEEFKTQEEADAFDEGFRSALPDAVIWGDPPSNGG